jgi:hypothetical protein
VAPQHQPAFEPKDQVLADRRDTLEPAAVEPRRDTGRRGPRMGRLDLERLTDERLEPSRRSVECVAFGHDPSLRRKASPAD